MSLLSIVFRFRTYIYQVIVLPLNIMNIVIYEYKSMKFNGTLIQPCKRLRKRHAPDPLKNAEPFHIRVMFPHFSKTHIFFSFLAHE